MMLKILIVEDNWFNRELFKDLLSVKGHDVCEVSTGTLAVETALKYKPDVILMDIQLPEMDGLTAAKKIRETTGIANTPIIALTAHAMEGDRKKALKNGFDAHISKPIDTRKFVSQIEDIYYLSGA